MNYDLFMLDYRGYGKSEGEIKSEKQFYNDVQKSYDKLKLSYNEKDIINFLLLIFRMMQHP